LSGNRSNSNAVLKAVRRITGARDNAMIIMEAPDVLNGGTVSRLCKGPFGVFFIYDKTGLI
jgi:hypothetical protein